MKKNYVKPTVLEGRNRMCIFQERSSAWLYQ